MKPWLIAVLASSALVVHTGTSAQEWPTRPVKILVGSAPGGGTDAMARAVASGELTAAKARVAAVAARRDGPALKGIS